MLLCCLIGFFYRSYFYSVLLMDLVHREETLYNVIRSVTRNGRSIILTGMPYIRPPLTEKSFEVTGSNQKGAYIGKNSNVRFDSDLFVCHYHLFIFPRAVHQRNRRSIKWWRTNRRKSLWNIDFGHYNNIQWRFKKWGRYWRLSHSTFATSRSGKSWNLWHGFKDLLLVLDDQNISKTLSLANEQILIIFEREISLARFTFLSAITFDESYYPSRFSSDSSQKGKIHLHREFSFKFFKEFCYIPSH